MTSFDDAKRLVWSVGRRRSIELPLAWKERLARWLTTESDCVQVIDVKDRRRVMTLNVGVGDVAALSADGSTLVCVEFSIDRFGRADGLYRFRFHDVYDNAPWLWAIAVPAGLAMAWVLWKTLRGRHRKNPAAASANGGGPLRRRIANGATTMTSLKHWLPRLLGCTERPLIAVALDGVFRLAD